MCKADRSALRKIGKRSAERQGFWPKKGFTSDIFKCKNCRLVFANPLPLPKDIGLHYEVPPDSYWVNVKPRNEEYLKHVYSNYAPYIKSTPDFKTLDIGSGLGHMLASFKMHGISAYGVEPSLSFIQKASEIYNIPLDCFHQSTFEDFVCNDNTYDLITCLAVLEHVPDPNALIEKALRILKPGGYLFLEIPSSKWLISKILNTYYKLTFSSYVTNLSPMHEPYHLYEFAPESFRKNAKILNYEIVDIKYYVCNTMFPSVLDKPLKYIMKHTNTGMELFVVIKKV